MHTNNLAILPVSMLTKKKEEERLFVPVFGYSSFKNLVVDIYKSSLHLSIKIKQSCILTVLPSCFWDLHNSYLI